MKTEEDVSKQEVFTEPQDTNTDATPMIALQADEGNEWPKELRLLAATPREDLIWASPPTDRERINRLAKNYAQSGKAFLLRRFQMDWLAVGTWRDDCGEAHVRFALRNRKKAMRKEPMSATARSRKDLRGVYCHGTREFTVQLVPHELGRRFLLIVDNGEGERRFEFEMDDSDTGCRFVRAC